MKDLFCSDANLSALSVALYNIYIQNGGKMLREKFNIAIKLLRDKFLVENDPNNYVMAYEEVMQMTDYPEMLRMINGDFHRYVYKRFQWNILLPARTKVEVGVHGKKILKSAEEIRPEDFGTMDLWREQTTNILNRNYKNDNKIIYRHGVPHARHYDKSNEGLRHNNPNESSLETPIYKHLYSDRQKINLCNYSNSGWYDI
jgi:hypothetical protein